MDRDLKIVIGIFATLIIVLVLMFVNIESCEDKGMQTVFSHYEPILVGKIITTQPVYKCK